MTTLEDSSPSNVIHIGGPPPKELITETKVIMPKISSEEFEDFQDPDIGEFYIGEDGELYLKQED